MRKRPLQTHGGWVKRRKKVVKDNVFIGVDLIKEIIHLYLYNNASWGVLPRVCKQIKKWCENWEKRLCLELMKQNPIFTSLLLTSNMRVVEEEGITFFFTNAPSYAWQRGYVKWNFEHKIWRAVHVFDSENNYFFTDLFKNYAEQISPRLALQSFFWTTINRKEGLKHLKGMAKALEVYPYAIEDALWTDRKYWAYPWVDQDIEERDNREKRMAILNGTPYKEPKYGLEEFQKQWGQKRYEEFVINVIKTWNRRIGMLVAHSRAGEPAKDNEV